MYIMLSLGNLLYNTSRSTDPILVAMDTIVVLFLGLNVAHLKTQSLFFVISRKFS